MFNLAEVVDPVFELKLPGGEIRRYDLWETTEKLARGAAALGEGAVAKFGMFDVIRRAFGYPAQEEVDAAVNARQNAIASGTPADAAPAVPVTLSRHTCLRLNEAITEQANQLSEELNGKKKASPSPQK